MTMANMIVQHDRVHFMTDTAHFSEDGTIAKFQPKCMVVPDHSMAITATGGCELGWVAAAMRGQTYADAKALLRAFPALVRRAYALAGHDPDMRWTRYMIGLYSADDDRAFGCTMFTTAEAGPVDRLPWRIIPTRLVIGPSVDQSQVFPAARDVASLEAFDPVRDAMPLIEAQRAAREGWAHIEAGCFVAGDIELTTISADGYSFATLHKFDDTEGKHAGGSRPV